MSVTNERIQISKKKEGSKEWKKILARWWFGGYNNAASSILSSANAQPSYVYMCTHRIIWAASKHIRSDQIQNTSIYIRYQNNERKKN